MHEEDSQPYQNAFGMTAEQMARALRTKFYDLYGMLHRTDADKFKPIEVREWDQITAGSRARWTVAVEMLIEKMEAGVQQLSASLATQAFADSVVGEGHYRRQPRSLQLVWEAVLRHAVNLLQAGRPIEGDHATSDELRRELDDAERYNWWQWVQEKYLAEKGVQMNRSQHGRQTVSDAAD